MTPEDQKKLEQAHKEAMEGIEALNKALKQTLSDAKKYVGLK